MDRPREVGGRVMLESRGGRSRPGDVMVLVRRRNDFGRALVRASEVARRAGGGAGPADADRAAGGAGPDGAADALLLPQDDLTFACLLTSPLGGLSDDSLMALAIERRRPVVGGAARAGRGTAGLAGGLGDSSRPCWRGWITSRRYALFAEALGPLGGRARLFARLGPGGRRAGGRTAERGAHLRALHPPSLQGFLHWLRRSGGRGEARGRGCRQPGTGHDGAWREGIAGAAGDPAGHHRAAAGRGPILWAADPATGATCRSGRRAGSCAARPPQRLRDAARQRRMEEHNRLLYVALTRAEDRLLVCGWQTRRGAG